MNINNTWLRKPRKPIGAAKREIHLVETSFYPTVEGLFRLHHLDFHHVTVAQASQPGWPDYTVFGDGWHGWLEIKAIRANGRPGKLDPAQERWRDTIIKGGGEWHCFTLPTDGKVLEVYLTGHTGRVTDVQWGIGAIA